MRASVCPTFSAAWCGAYGAFGAGPDIGDAFVEHPLPSFDSFAGSDLCMSPNRFVIDDAVHDKFVEQFAEQVRGLMVGDPDKPDTMIGPVINERQLDGLQERIAQARGMGVRQVAGGDADGLVLPPHVFADVKNDMPLAREELFGPVVPIGRGGGAGHRQ